MTKKYYRYYGGLLSAQERWLNKMAAKGYRLIRTGKLLYEFEECKPAAVNYCVEFIGQKSKTNAANYRKFLEDLGYQVFYKNVNLNYSIGKVRYRPWAEKGGRIATNSTTFNRELFIVEKENDGTEFQLHTSYEDKIIYCKTLRNPWLCIFLLFLIFAILQTSLALGTIAIIAFIPVVSYQIEITRLNKEAQINES